VPSAAKKKNPTKNVGSAFDHPSKDESPQTHQPGASTSALDDQYFGRSHRPTPEINSKPTGAVHIEAFIGPDLKGLEVPRGGLGQRPHARGEGRGG
jgi:hypothetical protein